MTLKTTKLRDAISFALAVGAIAGSGTAFAQEASGEATTELDRITVTGSRIRAAEGEQTSPVLSIDRAQIEQTGLTSVGDVLFNITSSDGGALRNITTSTNGSDGTQNISLRGLGSNRTLVLVNGRRWITQGDGTVDLNTIPIAVVERIEVLKDGASAIYGSDAIAGVINVITRKNFEGAEMRAYLGSYGKGDGFQQAYDFTVGSNGDRWNAVLGLSYSTNDPVFAANRTISKVPVFGGGDFASGGLYGSGSPLYARYTGVVGTGACPPSSVCSGTTLRPGEDGRQASDFRPWVSYTFNGTGSSDRYNFAPVNYLLQPIERFNVYGQGTLRLTDSVNANFTATYVRRNSNQQLAEVPVTASTNGANGPQWQFAPTATNVFNPFGTNLTGVFMRMAAVGPRNPYYTNDNIGVTGWLDGSFEIGGRGMYWDAGYSYLNSQFSVRGNNYVNLFNLRRALGPSRRNATTGALECYDATTSATIAGCTPFNVFGGPDLGLAAGVITRSEYDAMINYVRYQQNASSENTTKDYFANLSGDIVDLPAGPLGFAVGVERRDTTFVNSPDALVAGGGSSDNFALPTTGTTKAQEYYAELNVPILADIPVFKLLELNLAARRSDYNINGTFAYVDQVSGASVLAPSANTYGDTSKKIGLKWQIFDDLMLRGTYSESFRAPSVTELFQGQGESFPSAVDPCRTNLYAGLTVTERARCTADGVVAPGSVQPNAQIRGLVGGNPNLRPENAETRSFGIVYSPSWVEGLDLTLDYYNIKLTNVISTRSANQVLRNCYRDAPVAEFDDPATRQQFCDLIARAPNGDLRFAATAPFNLASGEVEGYDFQVAYRMPETSWGKFRFQWDSTYQTKNDLFGTVGEYNGAPTWRLRSNLATTWQKGDWDATWAMRYYSALDEACDGGNYYEYGLTPSEICNNDINDSNGNFLRSENRIGARVYHDIQVGVKTPWNGKVSIGGRNVFGKEPPITRNSFAHSFDGAYDLPGGGFYYLQYSQKF